ncbi:MAG: RNA-binding S4 domain-containing protein [Halomonadaceae bacterium]|nr:MAG: RNA-binding S4 domain-containing protein [Halomonadaceae bacterium]
MREVTLTHQPVELFKILKFEGIYASGGEAKAAIEAGLVQVNGEVETRKRKQMVAGDQVSCEGETLTLRAAAAE